jgi:hypothetical protein
MFLIRKEKMPVLNSAGKSERQSMGLMIERIDD